MKKPTRKSRIGKGRYARVGRTNNPRVTLHKNGRATISGLSFEDASHMVTVLALSVYSGMRKHEIATTAFADSKALREARALPDDGSREVAICHAMINLEWYRRQHWLANRLKTECDLRVAETHRRREVTLKERLRKNEADRASMRRLTAEIERLQASGMDPGQALCNALLQREDDVQRVPVPSDSPAGLAGTVDS